MSLNLLGIQGALVDHALSLGLFATVHTHEPKSGPVGGDLVAAIWTQAIGPLPAASGLAATTTRVEFTLRIYQGFVSEPQDAIDAKVIAAVDALIDAYTGDFTLSDLVRGIDCLGSYGTPLRAQAGYVNQDGGMYRVYDVTIPCIVNDLYDQAP